MQCHTAQCLLPPLQSALPPCFHAQVVGVEVQPPFHRLTYAEAMAKYASGEPVPLCFPSD